jgi:hypothetical protein
MNMPVISSEKGALSEVTGGRVIVIDELSENEIAASLEKAISGQWIQKSLRQFTLSESIEKYLQLYGGMIQ